MFNKKEKGNQVLPCFLSMRDNGELITYNRGFVEDSKVQTRDICQYSFDKIDSSFASQKSALVTNDAYYDIAYSHKTTFDKIAKNLINNKINTSCKVVKFIIYEVNIDHSSIKISKDIINELKEIAKSKKSDVEKAKSLEKEIFIPYGFFIPLTAQIGGMFIDKSNSSNYSGTNLKNKNFSSKSKNTFEFKYNIDYYNSSTNEMKMAFNSENKTIIGGNIHADNCDSWKESINSSNWAVIGYSNLKFVMDFVGNNIKNALEMPLKIIENKYESRKQYCEIINAVKANYYNFKDKGKGTVKAGYRVERNYPPIIYVVKYLKEGNGKFLKKIIKTINESYEDIIVGYEIIDCWDDGTNGIWALKSNPLLNYNASFDFTSQLFRGEKFKINIYLMKYPG